MNSGPGGLDATDPHVLREYSLLADGERGAVLGPRGDIAWMCAPRWDSGSLFSSLIGGQGEYRVTPRGRFVWGGYYEDDSMVWRSRWVTTDGIVECHEALAYPADVHRAVLLRRVHALDAPNPVEIVLRPRADYDTSPIEDLHKTDGHWVFRAGSLYLRWFCGPGARYRERDGALVLNIDLEAGQQQDFVLEVSDQPLPDTPVDPDTAWVATRSEWQRVMPRLERTLAPHDARRSFAVLRGLTSVGGGMVAAATTALPERAEEGRNYDYRYVWIRDQCYAGQAAAAAGVDDLLDAATRFVSERLLEHGDQLAPAYATNGAPVPDERRLGLPGYPGGNDQVGNRANVQFQLDAHGEALLLLAAAAERDRLDHDGWKAVETAADSIAKRWTDPDAGIWEIDYRHWTHSRLISAAGLRAVSRFQEARGRDWLALADHITATTSAEAIHPSGHWMRAADDQALDAALLLPPLRGAVAPDDPRSVATLRAYMRALTSDGYAYRFRHDDRPLHSAEGSFLLCGFLVALSLDQQGDRIGARAWFERTRAACGPSQLFSEEYDSRQHQMRGNLPQAFVHALMVETATRLAKEEDRAADPEP